MSAATTRLKAPTTDVDATTASTATPPATISAPGRPHLNEARTHLAAASDAFERWCARQTTAERSYVADGHEAIRLIDAATRELYRVRAALIGELRADEDERGTRVDRMIAEFRARRGGDPA